MKQNRLKLIFPTLAFMAMIGAHTLPFAHSAETGEIEKAETDSAKDNLPSQTWATEVQTKYNLTDAQMKSMEQAGLHGPQLAIAAELAKDSGKTTDQIIQMRTTDKMGWGEIAKKLGVPPGSIGHAVAALHHDLHEKRDLKKDDKKEDKKEDRKERREDRKKRREERKEDRHDSDDDHAAHPGTTSH